MPSDTIYRVNVDPAQLRMLLELIDERFARIEERLDEDETSDTHEHDVVLLGRWLSAIRVALDETEADDA